MKPGVGRVCSGLRRLLSFAMARPCPTGTWEAARFYHTCPRTGGTVRLPPPSQRGICARIEVPPDCAESAVSAVTPLLYQYSGPARHCREQCTNRHHVRSSVFSRSSVFTYLSPLTLNKLSFSYVCAGCEWNMEKTENNGANDDKFLSHRTEYSRVSY